MKRGVLAIVTVVLNAYSDVAVTRIGSSRLQSASRSTRIVEVLDWDGPSEHERTDGNEYGFHGVFHGTPSPDGIVQTFEFEGTPGHVSLQTLTLEERGGRTVLRTNIVFQSVEDRDGMVQSGMEDGARDSMERLEELVARLAPVR